MEGLSKKRDVEKCLKKISEMWPTKGNVSMAFLLNCIASDSPEVLRNAAKKHLIDLLLFTKKHSLFHFTNFTELMLFFLNDEQTHDMVLKENIHEVLTAIRYPL
ncbi:MAG TPA: hypothetical protein ENK09_10145 [Nitrospirae bacterium]|nr:hypothetical protein [Nitrospirota bacterium]